MLTLEDTFFFNIYNAGLSFIDCEFGDATFHNKEAAQFVGTEAPNGPIASIFGGGSLAMIVSLLALIVAGAALAVNISAKKKEDSPAEANSEE